MTAEQMAGLSDADLERLTNPDEPTKAQQAEAERAKNALLEEFQEGKGAPPPVEEEPKEIAIDAELRRLAAEAAERAAKATAAKGAKAQQAGRDLEALVKGFPTAEELQAKLMDSAGLLGAVKSELETASVHLRTKGYGAVQPSHFATATTVRDVLQGRGFRAGIRRQKETGRVEVWFELPMTVDE